jgi:hypothetical protein
MAKKINVAVLKEFMFNHGEKVALGCCAFLALVLGVMGLLSAMGAGNAVGSNKSWAVELAEHRKRIEQSMAAQKAPVLPANVETMMNPRNQDWKKMESDFPPQPYVIQADPNTSKRTNPLVLPIRAAGKNAIQLDYIRGLAFVHEVDNNGNLLCLESEDGKTPAPVVKVGPGRGKNPKPAPTSTIPSVLRKAVPVRMVVVSATFPMKQQVEEFQKALRMTSQEDMFKMPRADLPYVLGINVLRFEVVDGKRTSEEGEILIYVDWTAKDEAKDKPVQTSKELDDLLRVAVYDDDNPDMLNEHLWHGLNTPLPKLANARYPKFKSDTIEYAYWEEDDAKKDIAVGTEPKKSDGPSLVKNPKKPKPMEKDPKQQDVTYAVKPIPLKKLQTADEALARRLFANDKEYEKIANKYNIFHVLGVEQPIREDAQGPLLDKDNDPYRYFSAWDLPETPVAKDPPKADPKKKPVFPNWQRDALVRFIDPGAVPGKTYQYAIQVRMANPNFGEKKIPDVVFADLTRLEELTPSEWVFTPAITIPPEYFLYAVDQKNLTNSGEPRPLAKGEKAEKADKDHSHMSFQIHQWTDTYRDPERNRPLVIGNWVIGEQIVVRRGEAIGSLVDVRAPAWVKEKNAFEMPVMIIDAKRKLTKPGFKIDFKDQGERPILVDFVGGKEVKGNKVDEETAVDALILTADGKLIVLNSRDGAEAVQPDLPPPGVRRQERVLQARRTADAVPPPGDPKKK